MSANVNVVVDPNIKSERGHVDGESVDKKSRKAVLVQNEVGSYKFLPENLALELEKQHKVVVLLPSDPDYINGTRLALGVFEGFKKGEMIQLRGKAVYPEDIGKFEIDAAIKNAEEEVKKFETDKASGLIKVSELPPSLDTFEGKLRRRPGRPRLNPA